MAATLPTLTVSYSGFVNGDTSASLDTHPTITTTATLGQPRGQLFDHSQRRGRCELHDRYVSGTLP